MYMYDGFSFVISQEVYPNYTHKYVTFKQEDAEIAEIARERIGQQTLEHGRTKITDTAQMAEKFMEIADFVLETHCFEGIVEGVRGGCIFTQGQQVHVV